MFCFSYDPTDVSNLISGSSDFSKSSFNIYKFSVHVLLKPHLENSEHYSVRWVQLCCSLNILWDWNENWLFLVLWPLLSFPDLLAFWVQHFHSIIIRIWNCSAGIPSPPLALFVVMLPKAHLTSHSRMSGSRWVIIPLWLSGSWRSFL